MIKAMWDYVNVRYLNQKGQGMVEYALILAFVAVVAAGLIGGGDIATQIKATFTTIAGKLKTANDAAGAAQ